MAERAAARRGVLAGLLEAVERIRPILESGGARAETERALPDDVYDTLLDAGLFRMLVPRAFGGLELDPIDAYRVYEAIARIDSAAAWSVQISANHAGFVIWLPEAGAKELYAGGPDAIFAGGFFPPGPSVRVAGGWRVSARTAFASGCQRAQWFVVPVLEVDSESSKYDPHTEDAPHILAFVPRDEVDIVDTWHSVGMRGTFSADVVVDDVFVPDARVAFLVPSPRRSAAFAAAMYGTVPWLGVLGQVVVSVGVAESAIQKLIDLALRKTPSFGRIKLHDREMAQHHAARARALVGASRAFIYAAIRDARDEVERAGALSESGKTRCQLAASFGAEASADAVDLVCEVAGMTAIRVGMGLERHRRDARVMALHAAQSSARYEDVGKMLFGLPPTFFTLDL